VFPIKTIAGITDHCSHLFLYLIEYLGPKVRGFPPPVFPWGVL